MPAPTPEQFRFATGVMSFVFAASLLYLLHWQLRIWPDDRQKWAATAFVFALFLLIGQLCFAYLGGPPMGLHWRGVATFGGCALSCLWLALESRRHISAHLRRMAAAKRPR